MKLSRQQKPSTVVGLDIEAGSIAAAEVRSNGSAELKTAAVAPLPPNVVHEGEVVDADALTQALKDFFSQHKLSRKVRLGIGNQSVVVRTLRLPAIENPKELEAAVRFQAAEQIPMPLDQAVLEHQVVGGVPAEEGSVPQIDVVVVAARREMVSTFLEPLQRAGVEPVGVDLSAFGMIRALADAVSPREQGQEGEASRPRGAVLYCGVGDVTNLAVARGRACLFTRVSHAGLGPIADRLAAARGLSREHASQWLDYVGLERPLEEMEGDPETLAAARESLESGLPGIADELRLSLDYYRAQEGAVPVESIVLCGPGGAISGTGERMEAGLGLPIEVVQPPALAGLEPNAAARLTLPYGLALES
jgi:type IV pilus assembly protein PilM